MIVSSTVDSSIPGCIHTLSLVTASALEGLVLEHGTHKWNLRWAAGESVQRVGAEVHEDGHAQLPLCCLGMMVNGRSMLMVCMSTVIEDDMEDGAMVM